MLKDTYTKKDIEFSPQDLFWLFPSLLELIEIGKLITCNKNAIKIFSTLI